MTNKENVKQTHRELRDDLHENHLSYTNPNSNGLETALDTINSVYRSVEKTSDIISDYKLVLDLALLGKERIKNVHCEYRSFKNIEFMNKVRKVMKYGTIEDDNKNDDDDDDNTEYALTRENILKFGKTALSYFKIVPRPTFLIGALDKEQPNIVKKPRQKREKASDSDAVKTKISEVQTGKTTSDRNQTVGEVERVFKILYKYYKRLKEKPINLYDFIINPTSFSRTIENLFYLSFLVKDGYVKLFLDEDGLPVIEPLPQTENATANESQKLNPNNTNIQSMISLTKEEWKELIEVFNIDQAMIPDAHPQH